MQADCCGRRLSDDDVMCNEVCRIDQEKQIQACESVLFDGLSTTGNSDCDRTVNSLRNQKKSWRLSEEIQNSNPKPGRSKTDGNGRTKSGFTLLSPEIRPCHFFSLVENPEWTVIEVSMQFGTVLYGTLGRQRKVYGAAE